mgnify:CR=1 FL=1
MNNFEKILTILAKNLGLTVVLAAAIVLFAVFSDGLISGIITAVSALIGYAAAMMLYREFQHFSAKKSAPKKVAGKKTSKK